MVTGSIALPGALIMINNDISITWQSRLMIQLHIDEAISGMEFDLRLAADPDYPRNVRALRRRVLVLRDHRDQTNRTEMDIVMFTKEGLISVTRNCFGPPGQTYRLKDIYWGALCIYHTDLNRTCLTSSCSCGCDGYGRSLYYPATYDPNYPAENHWYNQTTSSCGCGCSCQDSTDAVLCSQYWCGSSGCIPQLDCRLVKA